MSAIPELVNAREIFPKYFTQAEKTLGRSWLELEYNFIYADTL